MLSVNSAWDPEQDALINEAARRERLRIDGGRDLGENLEQAASLIQAAFELAQGFAGRGHLSRGGSGKPRPARRPTGADRGRQLGVDDDGFAADELPVDPTRPEHLVRGAVRAR
jgi:hypothetical protein